MQQTLLASTTANPVPRPFPAALPVRSRTTGANAMVAAQDSTFRQTPARRAASGTQHARNARPRAALAALLGIGGWHMGVQRHGFERRDERVINGTINIL